MLTWDNASGETRDARVRSFPAKQTHGRGCAAVFGVQRHYYFRGAAFGWQWLCAVHGYGLHRAAADLGLHAAKWHTDHRADGCLANALPAAGGGGHHGGGGTKMGLDAGGVIHTVTSSPMCKMFEWDWTDKQAFWRQFLSGIFIVIVMTGLDQDMMQKT